MSEMIESPLRVGFVGLGAMGAPMAGHLARAGLLAAVCNRTHAKAESFAAEHDVQAIADPRTLAEACNLIVTCVTADVDVLALCDLFAQARPAPLVVDTSTIASKSARRAHRILTKVGGAMIDAPVSGGVEGAKQGRLAVMAGGDAADLERAHPVLSAFAARITHMGPVGAGQDTKAVNQVLVAGIAEAVCEGLALGHALGLDIEKLLPTLGAGAAACWFLDKRGPTMLRDEFATGFKLSLLLKDLAIVEALAREAGSDHAIVSKARADYTELARRGHGDEDISALIRLKRPRR